VEQQLAARLRKRQVAEFVDYDQINASELLAETAGTARLGFGFELVDQISTALKKRAFRPSRMQLLVMPIAIVALAVPVPRPQSRCRCLRQEVAASQIAHRCSLIGVSLKTKSASPSQRQLGYPHLVAGSSGACFLGDLGLEQGSDDLVDAVLRLMPVVTISS